MKRLSGTRQMLMVLCVSISATGLGAAEVKGTLPHVTAEGTVEIPAFAAPFSCGAALPGLP